MFSTIIFPPQITIIALFQVLVEYGLFNSLVRLTLVYVSIQLPQTIFILEGFFARLPQDLFDGARIDGYSRSSRDPVSPPRLHLDLDAIHLFDAGTGVARG